VAYERRAEDVVPRTRELAGADVGRDNEMSARRQMLEALELVDQADRTVTAARDLRRHDLIPKAVGVVAKQHHAPRLRIGVLVPERRERNPDFDRPAAVGDFRGGVPEEVRRLILARGIVGDRVVLDVAWRDEE